MMMRHVLICYIIFQLIAQENNTGPGMTSSITTILLEIEDTNDNNPYFPSQQTIFSVSEDIAVGVVVANITAGDVDSGDFGQFTFSLENNGHDGEFNITEQVITVYNPCLGNCYRAYELMSFSANASLYVNGTH